MISQKSKVKSQKFTKSAGFGIIEIIVAMGIMIIIAATGASTVLHSFSANRLGDEETNATLFAQEGIEAARSIKNQGWANLSTGTHGLDSSGGTWTFSGTSNTSGKYTRQVVISEVQRDAGGAIVESGGTFDPDTVKATSTATWEFSPTRNNSVSLVTYLTNFEKPIGLGDWQNPQTLGSVDLGPGNIATDVAVLNKIVYLTAEAAAVSKPDFWIVDATDGENPFIISSIDTSPGLNAVDVSGNYAYVANQGKDNQLQIIDITDINNPILLSEVDFEKAEEGISVFYLDNKVYVGSMNANDGREFHIVDVTDPANPSFLGSLEIGENVNGIYVRDATAYLAKPKGPEVQIVDVSDPANPSIIGSFDATGGSEDGKGVYLVGDRLYLVRLNGGNHDDHHELFIVDVGDPISPQVLGSKDFGNDINDLKVKDNLVFLVTSNPTEEFLVWDILDPANIVEVGSLNFPQTGTGIYYEDNIVYVSVRSNDALRIIVPSP